MNQLKFGLVKQLNENQAIGVAAGFNAIYMIDITSNKCKFLANFPEERNLVSMLFSSACVVENRVYFAPFNAQYIWEYDYKKNQFTKIDISKYGFKNPKFFDVISDGRKCYFFGCNKLEFLVLDMRNGNVSAGNSGDTRDYIFRRGILIGESYFFCPIKGNTLFEFSLRSMMYTMHELETGFRGAFGVAKYNNEVWICPRYYGDPFIVWNIEHLTANTIDNPYAREKKESVTYLDAVVKNGYLYVFAEMNVPSVRINLETKEIISVSAFDQCMDKKRGVYYILEDYVVLGQLGKEKSYYFDTVELVKFEFASERISDLYYIDTDIDERGNSMTERNCLSCCMVNENRDCKLENFVNVI